MIKVIACDMDGTLLGDDHKVAPRTLEAVQKACAAGIRFIIATGRNFYGAMEELKDVELTCDYIVSSGAEVRDPSQKVVSNAPISQELCRRVFEAVKEFPVSVIFCTDQYDYRIGTAEEIEESILYQIQLFHLGVKREEIYDSPLYKRIWNNTKVIADLETLEEAETPVYKIFLFSADKKMLGQIEEKLKNDQDIAVASSFPTNLEITDVKAQKGPVLKAYTESLGYKMEEVMAFGDSLNDYSMLSMDFGATIAMENAEPEIKAVSKYITKSNVEFGVAEAIEELLKRQG